MTLLAIRAKISFFSSSLSQSKLLRSHLKIMKGENNWEEEKAMHPDQQKTKAKWELVNLYLKGK